MTLAATVSIIRVIYWFLLHDKIGPVVINMSRAILDILVKSKLIQNRSILIVSNYIEPHKFEILFLILLVLINLRKYEIFVLIFLVLNTFKKMWKENIWKCIFIQSKLLTNLLIKDSDGNFIGFLLTSLKKLGFVTSCHTNLPLLCSSTDCFIWFFTSFKVVGNRLFFSLNSFSDHHSNFRLCSGRICFRNGLRGGREEQVPGLDQHHSMGKFEQRNKLKSDQYRLH